MTLAERQRRWRRRRKAGRAVFKIEVDAQALADVLTAGGLLAAWDADNPVEVEAAVGRFIQALSEWDPGNDAEVKAEIGRFLGAFGKRPGA